MVICRPVDVYSRPSNNCRLSDDRNNHRATLQVAGIVQLLLGLDKSSRSRVEVPQNSRPYFIVSFQTPPTWRARSPYSYPPGTGRPSYTPEHWVPFSSPLKTRMATAEVLESSSARGIVQVQVILRQTVSRPVRLGIGRSDFNFVCLTIIFFLIHVGRPRLYPPWIHRK
jgi:hypothetical protein